MMISGTGNSGFDSVYFGIQLITGLVLLIATIWAKNLPQWFTYAIWALLVTAIIITPIVWYVFFPARSGIDGAGRILFIVPITLVQLVLGITALIRFPK